MLLTRSRLCPRASPGSSLHLHVLSTPPAFVLSQDQTLREELHEKLSWVAGRPEGRPTGWNLYTVVPNHDGVLLLLDSLPSLESARGAPADGSNLDAHHDPYGS